MAVRTHEEIMESIRKKLGEDTSDEALSLIEDLSDTLKSSSENSDGDKWKKMYEDNDKMWREKYRDRFFNKTSEKDEKEIFGETDDTDDKEDTEPHTFDDLFKNGKE